MAAAVPPSAGDSFPASPTAAAEEAAAAAASESVPPGAADLPRVPTTPTGDAQPEQEGTAVPEEFDPDSWVDPGHAHTKVLERLLTMLTEAQLNHGAAAPKNVNYKALARMDIPEFHGGTAVSVHEYREFKRVVAINQKLYNAEPEQVAVRVWLACRGEAKRALDFLDVATLEGPDALNKIWAVLDAHC